MELTSRPRQCVMRYDEPAIQIAPAMLDGLMPTISTEAMAAADSPPTIRIDVAHPAPVSGPVLTARRAIGRVPVAVAPAGRLTEHAPRRRLSDAVIEMRENILAQLPDIGPLAISFVAASETPVHETLLADLDQSVAVLAAVDVVIVAVRPV